MSRIAVGIDGSKNSQAALEWAVDEARLRGADLHIVTTWQLSGPAEGFGLGEYYEACREASAILVAGAADWAAERLDTAVTHLSVNGAAVETLSAQSVDSLMLVVGARGHGGFLGLVLGSVSSQIAHHATCAVVIVPYPG